MARMFLALDIAPLDQQNIHKIQDELTWPNARLIPASNLHLTLKFLGNIDNDTKGKLISLIDSLSCSIELSTFNYRLDYYSLFKKPQVAYLGINEPPNELIALEKHLNRLTEELGFVNQHTKYVPHISVFRKAKATICSNQTLERPLHVAADSFSLYESISSKNGVRYIARKTWRLF